MTQLPMLPAFRQTIHCIWRHGWLRTLAMLVLLASASSRGPGVIHAQARLIVLTVRLLTVDRMPVPGVAVAVIDAATDRRLLQGMTDDAGEVRFSSMPPTEIRVRLTGQLPDGTALRHTRQDSGGIWVHLPAHNWLMDLRADVDGLVFPDLGLGNAGAPDAGAATAIAEGTLPRAYATAPSATVLRPTVPPRADIARSAAEERDVARATAIPTSNAGGIALLTLLIGLLGGVLWLAARQRM